MSTRWVDTNKGTWESIEVRSRMVTRDFKGGDKDRDELFVETPPLEAKKMLFSLAVTEGVGFDRDRSRGMKIDFIDVRRAYFHAKCKRDVYIELPGEDAEEGMCGKLDKSMYGTRDAAQNWEETYVEFMESLGFRGEVRRHAFFTMLNGGCVQ